MGGKVQGEGDYESARAYNKDTRKFVDQNPEAAVSKDPGPIDEAALAKAKAKSRGGGQDERDLKIFERGTEHPGRKP